MMNPLVAKEVDPDTTEVRSIMTVNPESVTPHMKILEALQLMHDSKYFIFLVCEVDVSVCGIVDVIYREGGSDTRRPMFNAVEDLKDDNESVISFGS